MGMFDTIMLKHKCPHCGKTTKFDWQTKDGIRIMAEYEPGNQFRFENRQRKEISVIGDCRSRECIIASAKQQIKEIGYFSGFSRMFEGFIYCDSKGKITNKIRITSVADYPMSVKGWKQKLKKEQKTNYDFAFKYLQDEDNAILCTHFMSVISFKETIQMLKHWSLDDKEIISALHSNDYKIINDYLTKELFDEIKKRERK